MFALGLTPITPCLLFSLYFQKKVTVRATQLTFSIKCNQRLCLGATAADMSDGNIATRCAAGVTRPKLAVQISSGNNHIQLEKSQQSGKRRDNGERREKENPSRMELDGSSGTKQKETLQHCKLQYQNITGVFFMGFVYYKNAVCNLYIQSLQKKAPLLSKNCKRQ